MRYPIVLATAAALTPIVWWFGCWSGCSIGYYTTLEESEASIRPTCSKQLQSVLLRPTFFDVIS